MTDFSEYLVHLDEPIVPKMDEAGRGCYGVVYKSRFNGAKCVVKKLHDILTGSGRYQYVSEKQWRDVVENFKREIQLLSKQRHPNIVQFLGVCTLEDPRDICLVMEQLEMDLKQFIEKRKGKISLCTKLSILRDTACGLSHLHSSGIVHRDLNAGNVLLTTNLQAKIADLGVSRVIDSHQSQHLGYLSLAPGATGYMPPEALQNKPVYGQKLDCFSFGHLTLYVAVEVYPRPSEVSAGDLDLRTGKDGKLLVSLQVQKRREWIQMLGDDHPLKQLICVCLEDNPEKRPDMKTVIKQLDEMIVQPGNRDVPQVMEESSHSRELKRVSEDEPRRLKDGFSELKKHWQEKEPSTEVRDKLKKHWQEKEPSTEVKDKAPAKTVKQRLAIQEERGSKSAPHVQAYSKMVKLQRPRQDERGSKSAPLEQTRPDGLEGMIPYNYVVEHTNLPSIPVDHTSHEDETQSFRKEFSELKKHWQEKEPSTEVRDKAHSKMVAQRLKQEERGRSPEQGKENRSESRVLAPGTICVGKYDFTGRSSDDLSFSKGDVLVIISQCKEPMANWYKARRSDGLEGMIPANYVVEWNNSTSTPEPKRPSLAPAPGLKGKVKVQTMPWYHGRISREEAEMLLDPPKNGLFLVRESTGYKGDYTLCVCKDSKVEHYRVRRDHRGWVTLDDKEYFENILELVKHYEQVSDGLCNRLKFSVKKTGDVGIFVSPKDFKRQGWAIPRKKLILTNKGEFGELWLADFEGTKVTIKTPKEIRTRLQETHMFLAEAAVMTTLKHANIVGLIGISLDDSPIYIVTEFMGKGSLRNYLQTKGRAVISKRNLLEFTKNVCAGMEYLESKNIIHRDLTARNVLISDSNVAKISHFWLASEGVTQRQVQKVPVKWTAPEALKDFETFSNKSDVWSFGILLWEIYSYGRAPHPKLSIKDIMLYVEKGYRLQMEPPDGCPDVIYSLMRMCWQMDPRNRPTFEQILKYLE